MTTKKNSEKASQQKPSIHIYTDGSCLGNPGIGGWGAIIQYDTTEKILSGADAATTNNRMEMMGIISALAWVKNNIPGKNHIKIFSDSNLIIQTLLQHWKRKKNIDLWAQLDMNIDILETQDSEIDWCWVKAHATNVHNNRVDKIAFGEATKIKLRK